jgi:hypothetical protein
MKAVEIPPGGMAGAAAVLTGPLTSGLSVGLTGTILLVRSARNLNKVGAEATNIETTHFWLAISYRIW